MDPRLYNRLDILSSTSRRTSPVLRGLWQKKEHRWQRPARSAGRQELGLEFPVFLRPSPAWGGCHSRKVRAISTARLNASRRLHLQPIDVVVSHGPPRVLIPGPASRLDAFSAYPFRAWLPCHAPGGTTGTPAARPTRSSRTSVSPRPDSTPATDRDRTVSRRSEPSSRATLMGEQPNPWDLLQPQDVTSRHRGAKPLRRYELLGAISLLSPEYLLSFERRPSHKEPPDHYALLSHLFGSSPSQSSTLLPLRSQTGYQSARGYLWKPPLRFWRRPPQSNYPPCAVPGYSPG